MSGGELTVMAMTDDDIRREIRTSLLEMVNVFRDERSDASNKSEQAIQLIQSHQRECMLLGELASEDRKRQEMKIDNVDHCVSELAKELRLRVDNIYNMFQRVSFSVIGLLVVVVGVLIYPFFNHTV